jgi:hypothetical protein
MFSHGGGTGPTSGRLFDADGPATPNDNALINLLVLEGIMVVIGLVSPIMSNILSLGARFRRQSLAPRGATLAGVGD